MTRTARKTSNTGIYHIIARGINKQQLFKDDYDNEKYLEILKECKDTSEFELYAYCLMGNHVHLLIKTGKEDLELIFKRIGVRYAAWHNWKYERVGHLFQDRFKSEPVEDDKYFLTVLRYIHQNPKKDGFCAQLDEYSWSSYPEYVRKRKIVDTAFALSITELGELIEFHSLNNEDICLENRLRLTDGEVKKIIWEICKREEVEEFHKLERTKRDQNIKKLIIAGASIRQISRLTGVSKAYTEKALKE